MAEKEIKKTVQKGSTGKKRRLKRSVRKSLGALSLAAAIAVAAIPTDGLRAASGDRTAPSFTTDSKSIIPQFTQDDTIYLSNDGNFRFAFHRGEGGAPVAVILGYTGQALGDVGGEVVIPEQLEPYVKFTDSMGTSGGYVAVGQHGNFLFWKKTESVPVMKDGEQEQDENGNPKFEDKFVSYEPCYADTIAEWGSIKPGELYYDKNQQVAVPGKGNQNLQEEDGVQTTDANYQRIMADVAYIGNQYLVDQGGTDHPTGIWTVGGSVTSANPDQGVFAGDKGGNIRSLKISSKLRGIGDYAFYRCGSLGKVTLADGLIIIGEGAFSDCVNMQEVSLDVHGTLQTIGQKAFYNCQALQTFTLPLNVTRIGDQAFENCSALRSVDLLSAGNNNQLTDLGRDLFKGCTALQNITFPSGVRTNVYLSSFQGCLSLQWISTRNMDISFVEEPGVFTYDQFKAMLGEGTESPVNGGFYFEGLSGSNLQSMTREKCFAFSYLRYDGATGTYVPEDRYELTVQENSGTTSSGDSSGRAIYEVNSSRHLTRYEAGPNVKTVTIPSRIGPYPINYIDQGTFQNKCHIEKVTIPANVREVAADAFRGCHNLENVIWRTGDVVIGANAFKTQDNTSHEAGCGGTESEADRSPSVKLKFAGPVSSSSGPFNYAMSESGRYNAENQIPSYITYYTGWPTNMEIQYNTQTGLSELVNFPSLKELKDTTTYTSKNYAYIDKEHELATTTAIEKYVSGEEATMTEMERDIIDAAMNIVIPEGVQSVKDGLFQQKEKDDTGTLKEPKTVTAYSLQKITCTESEPDEITGTFAGCKEISSIRLLGGVTDVDDHAFKDCEKLSHMELPSTVEHMGTRPFAGCKVLDSVSFGGGPYFTCENSIIYELKNGAKDKIVECLEGRSNPRVSAEELAGVTALYPEAFMGSNVSKVDLSQSTVTEIPERAFKDTQKLREVILPRHEPKSLKAESFANSSIEELTIPGVRAQIDQNAFKDTDTDNLWFYCEENSDPWLYAVNNDINRDETKPERYWVVRFVYYDEEGAEHQIGEEQEILEGEAAVPPEPPARPGLVFQRWQPSDYLAVYKDVTITANYVDENEVMYTVTFLNEDGSEYTSQRVVQGQAAIMPQPPYKKGFVFVGWRVLGGDGSTVTTLANIQGDLMVQAVYRTAQDGEDDGSGTQSTSPSPGASGSPNPSGSASPSPGTNGSASPSPGTNSSASPSPGTNSSASPSPGAAGTFYTLTVQNGSGSGSYLEGSQPVIIANDPASGQEFDYWSVSPEDVKIASKVLSASIVTMPAKDVTVTAHYKAKTGSSGGGYTGSGNSSQRPNGTSGVVSRGGTTVVIDKNGLSNTGVVSATVNGSSDNFTVKISESAEATEAALRALMAEYGDNLDNIKFFPMDISLYDSTGTTKITDTTGLSVSITLPLPDSLITYAGNNKVASVVNDRLERLSARFTTIQGVSCITFTAEHFSPYVIYVNTGDLSSGLVSDETPKTGDFIHPKWFLSIALACLSFVLFMQRDTKKPKKVKAKVRA